MTHFVQKIAAKICYFYERMKKDLKFNIFF